MRNLIAVLALSTGISGCIPYPIYKTLQPSATVRIQDRTAAPIPDAEVTLISNAYPYGREKGRETVLTSPNGQAHFEAIREWRIETLMIHGAEVFFWNWCVRKHGYKTYQTSHNTANNFQAELEIRLEPGFSTPCPVSELR
jgi:hypothetical protein